MDVFWSCSGRAGAVGCDAAEQQVHLAAEAEPEDCVQQRGRQGEAGRDRTHEGCAGEVPDRGRPLRRPDRRPGRSAAAAGSSRCAGAARRGRTNRPEQVRRRGALHAEAPPRRRTARPGRRAGRRRPCRRGEQAQSASTTLVSIALNCGPRGSISTGLERLRSAAGWWSWLSWMSWGRPATRRGRVPVRSVAGRPRRSADRVGSAEGGRTRCGRSGHSTQRRAHAAVVHCAALGQHRRGHGVKSRQGGTSPKSASQDVSIVSIMRKAGLRGQEQRSHRCHRRGRV